MPPDYKRIGAALKAARLACGLTQKGVAEQMLTRFEIKMTDANISLIEGGAKTPVENIEAFAKLVGADVEVLFAPPGDRLGELALRLARAIPLLDPAADETVLETLEGWCRKWEGKYGALAPARPSQPG
jgi:transcriptional regulator with XRE-family HTH domain